MNQGAIEDEDAATELLRTPQADREDELLRHNYLHEYLAKNLRMVIEATRDVSTDLYEVNPAWISTHYCPTSWERSWNANWNCKSCTPVGHPWSLLLAVSVQRIGGIENLRLWTSTTSRWIGSRIHWPVYLSNSFNPSSAATARPRISLLQRSSIGESCCRPLAVCTRDRT